MIVNNIEPWEEGPLLKEFKKLIDDIDTGELKRPCQCQTVGEDDGETTCWRHHDCNNGNCTHMDGGE